MNGKVLEGRVAIITGSSRGIGREIALKFAEKGVKTVVTYHNSKEKGEEVAYKIIANGGEALLIQVDVSRYEDVQQMVKKTIEKFGKIDILVNNAAISGPVCPFYSISLEDWDNTIRTNLSSVFYCCKEVVPHMINQKYGRIINVSSKGGISGYPYTGVYNATKAAIVNLTKTLSNEISSFGVTVNCILPGLVWTDMAYSGLSKIGEIIGKSTEEMKNDFINKNALKRLIESSEIAEVVLFLSSPYSSCITGETIDLSGGG